MKNLIKFLPAMAILLASGLALASHVSYNAPNVKNSNLGMGAPVWVTLQPSDDIQCNDNEERQCLAYQDEFENISDVIHGYEE